MSWFQTGASIADRIKMAAEEAAHKNKLRESGADRAFRFFLKKGEKASIVFLDDTATMGVDFALPRFHEHNLRGPDGKFNVFEICPGDFEPCPLCERGEKRYFVIMCSVLDTRPYTNKNGVTVRASRKLLPIKVSQMDKFRNIFADCQEQYGTIRGLHIGLYRPMDDKSASIGEPAPLKGREFWTNLADEEIVAQYGHPALKNQEGKVYKAANADLQPFNYDILFPRPSGEDLRKRYGGRPPMGSAQSNKEAWEDTAPEPTTRRVRAPQNPQPDDTAPQPETRRVRKPEPPQEVEPEEEQPEEPQPAATRRRIPQPVAQPPAQPASQPAAQAPSRRPKAAEAVVESSNEVDDFDEDNFDENGDQ